MRAFVQQTGLCKPISGFFGTLIKLKLNITALVDLSQTANDELKPIDVYAIGFEEMVDLDAKNIMNARLKVNH